MWMFVSLVGDSYPAAWPGSTAGGVWLWHGHEGRFHGQVQLQTMNPGLCNSIRYQRWSLLSRVLKYRLKIGLKDIIDSQYTDQVGPLCTRIHKHTCDGIAHIHQQTDGRWKNIRVRREVCVFIFFSGSPSVMWSLVEFTWRWSGFQQLLNRRL